MQIVLITLFLLMFGCSTENNNYEPVITGKSYVLNEWPDSLYVQSLDSIIKAEPVKNGADSSEKTEISLNSFQMPKVVSAPTKNEKPTPTATTSGNTTKKVVNSFTEKDITQKQIDDILDKISKSGYDSLTKEEKEFLFKAGK